MRGDSSKLNGVIASSLTNCSNVVSLAVSEPGSKSTTSRVKLMLESIICIGLPLSLTKLVRSISCLRTISPKVCSSAEMSKFPLRQIAPGML